MSSFARLDSRGGLSLHERWKWIGLESCTAIPRGSEEPGHALFQRNHAVGKALRGGFFFEQL